MCVTATAANSGGSSSRTTALKPGWWQRHGPQQPACTTEFSASSNIQSRICATDSSGNPRWAVSPNLLHIAEIGTEESRYIWGGPGGAARAEPSYPLCSRKCTGSEEGYAVV